MPSRGDKWPSKTKYNPLKFASSIAPTSDGFSTTQIISVNEPFKTGTLIPLPLNLPAKSGNIFDIALAALNVDIASPAFDGTPIDRNYQNKLNFNLRSKVIGKLF